jgi:hypothetical protein
MISGERSRILGAGADDQRQGWSRDAALIALAQARDEMGGPDERLRPDGLGGLELRSERASKTSEAVEASPPMLAANPVKPLQGTTRGRSSMWKLLGLGALVPIGAVILAWHFLYRQADVASVSASSTPKDFATKSARSSPTPPQAGQQTVTAVASVESPRSDPALATMTRQLANSKQEIDELKARQAQMLLDNSELHKRIDDAQALARSNAGLINDLRSAQTQMTQDNADLAARLEASQGQVTNLAAQLDANQTQMAKIATQIKASQDQIARPVEQKQRARPLSSASLPTGSPTKKPAPKPGLQQARPQTENPARPQ